jgi:hypothetical protein
MSRYAVTRSTATVFMAVAVAAVLALVVAVPVAGVNPITVGYAAMVVVGAGMLLREQVLVRVDR